MPKLTTLKKGLQILLLYSERSPTLDVPTITNSLNIPSSTVYRYLETLKDMGLIEEDSKPGHYRLGARVLELAKVAREQMDLVDLSLPIMESLSAQTGETIVLAARKGVRAICIERIKGRPNLRASYERGRSQYLHAGASAKVIMAYLGEEERESLIEKIGLPKLTETTITDPHELRDELERIREKGFAVSDGEVDPGVRAVAAPIFDEEDRVIASISIGGPIDRIRESMRKRVPKLAPKAGEEITKKVKKYGI